MENYTSREDYMAAIKAWWHENKKRIAAVLGADRDAVEPCPPSRTNDHTWLAAAAEWLCEQTCDGDQEGPYSCIVAATFSPAPSPYPFTAADLAFLDGFMYCVWFN
jgi:hypothetical protein